MYHKKLGKGETGSILIETKSIQVTRIIFGKYFMEWQWEK